MSGDQRGVSPTLNDVDRVTAEGVLLDFDGDLYGRSLRMEFFQCISRRRGSSPTLEDLRAEVLRKAEQTRGILQRRNRVHSQESTDKSYSRRLFLQTNFRCGIFMKTDDRVCL